MRELRPLVTVVTGVAGLCLGRMLLGRHEQLAAEVAEVAALGVAALVAAAVVQARRHHRLVRGLRDRSRPASVEGTPVRLGDLGGAVFVAGLGRPTIFCDRRVPSALSAGQLRAVLLHERAHQRSRDPLRLLLLGTVAPVVCRVPGGRQRLADAVARREIAADLHAIAGGATRSDLAAALLVLPALTVRHVAGFTPAIDQRLRALLDDGPQDLTDGLRRTGATTTVALLLAVTLCVGIVHPALSAVLTP